MFVPADASNAEGSPDLERGPDAPSTSHEPPTPAWADQQIECAICLEMFVKGDRVRVLPCYHLFHIDEIDEWLINKKKLVRCGLNTCHATAPVPDYPQQCPICKSDVTQPQSQSQSSAPSDPDAHHDEPTSPRAASSSAHPDERTPLLQPPSDQRAGSPSSR